MLEIQVFFMFHHPQKAFIGTEPSFTLRCSLHINSRTSPNDSPSETHNERLEIQKSFPLNELLIYNVIFEWELTHEFQSSTIG